MGNLMALQQMNATLDIEIDRLLANFQVRPFLRDQIQTVHIKDPYLKKMKEKVEVGTNSQFAIVKDGMLVMEDRVCVPDTGELRRQIMDEAHFTPYTMHPGSTKMYQNLKPYF